jgi:F1F0 ATPase subunit 2
MNIQVLKPLLCLAFGAAAGVAFFGALAWNVRLYCGCGARLALLAHAARLLGIAAVFAGVAELGAVPLLLALTGFQLARVLAIRAKRPAFETAP